jgi:hypothetical protein
MMRDQAERARADPARSGAAPAPLRLRRRESGCRQDRCALGEQVVDLRPPRSADRGPLEPREVVVVVGRNIGEGPALVPSEVEDAVALAGPPPATVDTYPWTATFVLKSRREAPARVEHADDGGRRSRF